MLLEFAFLLSSEFTSELKRGIEGNLDPTLNRKEKTMGWVLAALAIFAAMAVPAYLGWDGFTQYAEMVEYAQNAR